MIKPPFSLIINIVIMSPTLCSSTTRHQCKSTIYHSSVPLSPSCCCNESRFFNRLVPHYSSRRSNMKKNSVIASVTVSSIIIILSLCHNSSILITLLHQCYFGRRWHLLQNLPILEFPVHPTPISPFHIPSHPLSSGAWPWWTTLRLFLSCNAWIIWLTLSSNLSREFQALLAGVLAKANLLWNKIDSAPSAWNIPIEHSNIPTLCQSIISGLSTLSNNTKLLNIEADKSWSGVLMTLLMIDPS